MPTYLCHGFRWHRQSVRYFIVKNDIEDGATEWIVAPNSQSALIEQFYELYDFLPPLDAHRNPLQSPSYLGHRHAPSDDSSYVSRTNSSEYHNLEEHKSPPDDGAKTRNRSASQRSIKSPSRPRTSGRDESAYGAPLSPLPQPSPGSDGWTKNLSPITFLEEFDPKDESRVSGPWAYVADHVVQVGTSVSIADEMFRYEARAKQDPSRPMRGPSDEYGRKVPGSSSKKAGWFEKLRDQLQRGESIKWYVVVCGDEERYNPTAYDDDEMIEEEEEEEEEGIYEEEECGESSSAKSQDRRAWLRQSRSTQSTEATSTTTTGTSVIDGGFEFRIPELAGFAARTPIALPERKRKQLLAPPAIDKDLANISLSSPSKSPLSPPSLTKLAAAESPSRTLKSARSSIGLRKLFSRRGTETSI
ncbi:hypothetical protein GGR57DRAFT_497080 [Xylariaceae sp. FL1272]|nr:hypothetical protein GGR57DRAFT_497080 [Xylariaceae sp. FL1272]